MLFGNQDPTSATPLYAILIVTLSADVLPNAKYSITGVTCNYIDQSLTWKFMEFPAVASTKTEYTENTGAFSDATVYATATANSPTLAYTSLVYSHSILGETGYAVLELTLPNVAQVVSTQVYTEKAVMQLKFNGPSTDWVNWGPDTTCSVLQGVINSDNVFNPVTCTVDYTQPYIEIRNFT